MSRSDADWIIRMIQPYVDEYKKLTAEYAQVAAENERLKALIEENLNLSKRNLGKTDALRIERDTLAAENERLRKAGDAMCRLITSELHNKNGVHKMLLSWLDAAKEGRDAK